MGVLTTQLMVIMVLIKQPMVLRVLFGATGRANRTIGLANGTDGTTGILNVTSDLNFTVSTISSTNSTNSTTTIRKTCNKYHSCNLYQFLQLLV